MDIGVLIRKLSMEYFLIMPKLFLCNNDNILKNKLEEFKNSIGIVNACFPRLQKGLKMNISKDFLQLSVDGPIALMELQLLMRNLIPII
jgi:hypothetical protein